MVKTLRLTLIQRGSNWISRYSGRSFSSWASVSLIAVVFLPVLPGLYWEILPVLHMDIWKLFLSNPLLPHARITTAISAILGTVLAIIIALLIAIQLYPGSLWLQLRRRLPLMLSVPHAAFSIGFFFLIAPSGWLSRLIAQVMNWTMPPAWVTVQDEYGLSLALALAIKESWFLLWALSALLNERIVSQQMTIVRTLGYNRWQAWRYILLPQLLPRLGWPFTAVFAYSLSVVDMSIILGPTNPPTLAVLIWRWLTDADPIQQAQGSVAAVVLFLFLASVIFLVRFLWSKLLHSNYYPNGKRVTTRPTSALRLYRPLFWLGYTIVILLIAWSLAGTWFFPAVLPDAFSLHNWLQADFTPFSTSLWLASAVCFLCLPIALIWLEWGPQRYNALIYIPLIVPAMPLVAAQYAALLAWDLDSTIVGLIWSHLLWVLPYMILTLVGPYREFDQRYMTTARALGFSRLHACLTVKWPILIRPILASMAVGFAVSIAQYLPTLFAGGGRFVTVTTEAVALSSGGSRQTLAVQALLQIILPLSAFFIAALIPVWLTRNRKGLH